MESRLPKPKINLKKAISTMDINSKTSKMTKEQDTMSQTAGVNSLAQNLKKTKSVHNVNGKATNENKPPLKTTMVRSKTMMAITRPTAAGVKPGMKRAGTVVTNAVDAKKPNIRPAPKTKTSSSTLSNNSTASKIAPSTNNKSAPSKPHKWDLKGRLAHTSNELTNVKQKHEEITTKYKDLQSLIDTLKSNEKAYKSKVEEYETMNKSLVGELNTLKLEVSKLQEQQENISKRLKESDDSLKDTSEKLEKFKEKCNSQESLLSVQTVEIQSLKSDIEAQKKVNEDLTTVKEELQSLVHNMDIDRRLLHNVIQELKGNIRVFCRVRPRTPKEANKPLCAINFIDECTIEVGKLDGSDSMSCSGKLRGTKQEFSFDKVFPPNATQENIFEELSLLVQSALEGYNVCVFAYGQTGSGKTYTMEGEFGDDTEGMIPRTVRHIFREMRQFELLGWVYRIEASFLEIYNEHIVDLLDAQPKTHEIRMADSKGHDLYVSNLKIEEIRSPEELHECLLTAQRNRAVAATQANERSSRSHSVARIKLIGTHEAKKEVCIGNLNLVDLAGSERLKGEEAARTAETKNINKSLANLGNVILALLKKQEHVPYRNSKLTHLLMPSLGGNSKTLMLLNISPLDECYNETLNSLRFASNVNNCKTGNVKRTRTVL